MRGVVYFANPLLADGACPVRDCGRKFGQASQSSAYGGKKDGGGEEPGVGSDRRLAGDWLSGDCFDYGGVVGADSNGADEEITGEVEDYCRAHNLASAGRIPYDVSITQAQLERKSVVEYDDGPAVMAIQSLWQNIQSELK